MNALLIAISVVLAVMRIGGAHDQVYQAAAHVFIGWLIGAGYYQYSSAEWGSWNAPVSTPTGESSLWKFGLVLFLSVVEVACFIWFRFFS